MFILIVLMSFASAGFFSNLFKAKITGHDIGNPSGCYNCITQSGGEWCDDGYSSFCKDPWSNDYCYGESITSEYECPCPASCDDIFSCYGWQCGDCYGDGYDMSDYCYIDCGTCDPGEICNENHICELDCHLPKYELSRQVDELSETCKADSDYDTACCDPSDCVVNGECFASDTYHQPPANHLCGGDSGEYCYQNIWYNEKSSLPPGICIDTFKWEILHRIINPDDPDGECEEFTDGEDEGCCQSDAHCVFNGYCYRSAEEKPMDGSSYFDGYYFSVDYKGVPNSNPSTAYDVISGPGSGEFCFENVWYDEKTFANYCGNGICDSGETYLNCKDCTAPQCIESTDCTEFACKVGTCSAAGTCSYSSNKPDDTGCGGDNICCGGSCTSPTCTLGSCEDGNDCTTNICEDVGTCDAGCSDSTKGNNEPCTGGVCYSGNCMAPACTVGSCVDDNNDCTDNTCINPGKWDASCPFTLIDECTGGDGCCPPRSGCNFYNDADCDDLCNDGNVDSDETCKSCPGDVSCPNGKYCNMDTATCEPGCGGDNDCSGGTKLKCDISSLTCVECLTASVAVDCGAGYACTSGSCDLEICDYKLANTGDISFPSSNRAIAAKFMKNIRTKCNAGFTINLLSALPSTYDVPADQKIIMIFNITAIDLASGNDADLDFTINESELTIPNIENVTIYVEDNTEATEWTSLEGDIVADSTSSGMFNYKVNTPHFSLFLITEPELCGNGVFDTGYEECDGSTHCTDCVCDATFPSDGSGKCVEAITGGDCSPVGNETCTGYNLIECDSDLIWDNKGIVLGECGVECLSGEKDCDSEISLSCGLNHKWVIQGKINGLCGYTVDPDDPDDSSDRCGNGYCNYDEDENSCPEDCAEDNGKETNWFLIILILGVAILILVIVFVLFKIFSREKGKIGLTTSNNYPTRPRPKRPPVQRSYR